MKKLIVFLIVLCLIAFIAIIASYAYLKSDIFLNPQQAFNKYLALNIKNVSEYNIKPFDEIAEMLEKEKTEADIYVFDPDGKKYSVNIVSEKLEKILATANISFIEDKDLNVELHISNDAIGVRSKELYDKYIVLENRDFQKIADNSEMNKYVPNKLPLGKLSDDDKEIIKTIFVEYKDKLIQKLDGFFSAEKNAILTLDSKTVKTTKYSLNITRTDINNIVTELLEELYNDQRYITLYNHMYDCKPDIQAVSNFKEVLDSIITDENITVSLYVLNSQVIKTEIKYGEESINFFVNDNELNINCLKKVKDYNSDYSFFTNEDTASTEEKYVYCNYGITLKNNFDGKSGDFSIDFKINYSEDSDLSNYNNSLKVKTTKNGNTYNIKIGCQFDGKSQDIAEIEFKVDSAVNIEDIDEDNAIIINDYTLEELMNLYYEIVLNAQKFATGNQNSWITDWEEDTPEYTTDDTTYDEFISNLDTNYDTEANNYDKEKIGKELKESIESCLNDFSLAKTLDPEVDINNYLNIDNISRGCNGYKTELIDGSTIKCTMDDNLDVYYAKMIINGGTLSVDQIDVYTDAEYVQLGN